MASSNAHDPADYRTAGRREPLMRALQEVVNADLLGDYDKRQEAILKAIGYAVSAKIVVGFRVDLNELTWPVVYFELPTGQVSWHMPQHPLEWDKHSTEEKNLRVIRQIRDDNTTMRSV